MSTALVSVIIPVRNAKPYIERCLESVGVQTYEDIEIILILNDSKDESKSICNTFALQDKRVRIIETSVAGVSNARNLGIENAKGKRIIFLDADDYLHNDFISRMYEDSMRHGVEIVASGFTKGGKLQLGAERVGSPINKAISSSDYLSRMLSGQSEFDGYVWGKMFLANALADVRFDTSLSFSEDTDFLVKLLEKEASVFISSQIGYFYSQDTAGITKSKDTRDRMGSLAFSEKMLKRFTGSNLQISAASYMWRSAYYITLQDNISKIDTQGLWRVIRQYRRAVLANLLSPSKYRVLSLLSYLGPALFKRVVSFMRRAGVTG